MTEVSYQRWRQRLAGEKVVTYTEPDEGDVGFYRLPVKERKKNAAGQNNGQWKTIGFKPVALFVADGALVCQIGPVLVTEDARNDAWPHFSQNPITEEVWRAVAERGEAWPDFKEPEPARDPEQMAVLEQAFIAVDEERAAAPPEVDIQRRLTDLEKELPHFAKVESDEQSSAARGLQARFQELRGEAAGHYEAANRPLLEKQKKLREIWFPLRDQADAAKTKLGDAMGAWEDVKRVAAKRAAEEAARKQREHDAAVAAAAAADRPAPPPPPEVKPNTPEPSAQIKAAGARTASVKLVKIVTEIDIDKAFAQFRNAPEVREVLMTLAQRAVTAGLPVDGATIEERSKVR